MWQVICIGPGPVDRPRRVLDRGPMLTSQAVATGVADWLRATGLYERVSVEARSVSSPPLDAAPALMPVPAAAAEAGE